MRRNVDMKMIMFNNRIYGLTKGQASPTSPMGKKTKSTPMGTIETPIIPLNLVAAAEASFIARSVDTHSEHLQEMMHRAGEHSGAAFLEVLQNCNIFNDGAWEPLKDGDTRDDMMMRLEHGQPIRFVEAL
jgi:2-oxoglutarate ferredoxin oxidoreductase subunit beta